MMDNFRRFAAVPFGAMSSLLAMALYVTMWLFAAISGEGAEVNIFIAGKAGDNQ